jgi:signal transduction histidine kinase
MRQFLALSRRARDHSDRANADHVVGTLQQLLARIAPHASLQLQLRAANVQARIAPIDLERILINLVVNAGHAVERGGPITVSTSLRHVPAEGLTVASGSLRGGDYVELAVADGGTGIAPDVLPRIFEPFFTTKAAGTGLGLPSVVQVACAAGGGVAVESQVGTGTRFTVFVPTERPDAPEGGPETLE